ncbi:hypothetical protein ABTX15_24565 [Micromonospora sp. NPDC094482]|uniref:hypothetical protein n=1 Tax=unclassified Micromonospora TaxID=2617518 RepID=UPI0033256D8B
MEQPAGFISAIDAVHRHVNSARPNAPIQAERPRPARLAPTRLAAAGALRRLADRIQPRPAPTVTQCS